MDTLWVSILRFQSRCLLINITSAAGVSGKRRLSVEPGSECTRPAGPQAGSHASAINTADPDGASMSPCPEFWLQIHFFFSPRPLSFLKYTYKSSHLLFLFLGSIFYSSFLCIVVNRKKTAFLTQCNTSFRVVLPIRKWNTTTSGQALNSALSSYFAIWVLKFTQPRSHSNWFF